MDIFSKRCGEYWATVGVFEQVDGTFSWHLRLAVDSNSDTQWEVASGRGFKERSLATVEGMDALGLLDAVHPLENSFAVAAARPYSTLRLH